MLKLMLLEFFNNFLNNVFNYHLIQVNIHDSWVLKMYPNRFSLVDASHTKFQDH